ncbi:MAG: hypothetical protein Q4G52_12940 [Clostridia bacterium]|nr:hypothetical protein [Clostridia bacterium]
MSETAFAMLEASLTMLEDGCPRDPRAQLCRYQSDYDEDACCRCWRAYLLDVANGPSAWARDRYAREADALGGR